MKSWLVPLKQIAFEFSSIIMLLLKVNLRCRPIDFPLWCSWPEVQLIICVSLKISKIVLIRSRPRSEGVFLFLFLFLFLTFRDTFNHHNRHGVVAPYQYIIVVRGAGKARFNVATPTYATVHVQHTYYCVIYKQNPLTLFQEGFNVEPRRIFG